MKDLAKPKNIVTNYNFELPTDEEIKDTMKHGLSKRVAINFLGNAKMLNQNKNLKEHHILDGLQAVIDTTNHSEKIYYDNQTVGYNDNTSFYNVVGKQILDLHLFGYRKVQVVQFTRDFVKVQLYSFDGSQWKKSFLIFKKLSSYNPHAKDIETAYHATSAPSEELQQDYNNYLLAYKNVLFVNDDKFADANKLDIISDFNQNVIISNNNIYEYRNHVYTGASFYATPFFRQMLAAHSETVTDEEKNALVELEKQKFAVNHFEFSGRMDTLNLPEKIASDYRSSFKKSVELQDLSTYYDYYGTYASINEYLDSLIINRYKDFDSFAEYELSFALRYVTNNVEYFTQDNQLGLAPTVVDVDEVVKQQMQTENVQPTVPAPVEPVPTQSTETPAVEEKTTEPASDEKPASDSDPLATFMNTTDDSGEEEPVTNASTDTQDDVTINDTPSSAASNNVPTPASSTSVQSESSKPMMSEHAHKPVASNNNASSSLPNSPALQGLLDNMVDNLQGNKSEPKAEDNKEEDKETKPKHDTMPNFEPRHNSEDDDTPKPSSPRMLNGVDLSDFN